MQTSKQTKNLQRFLTMLALVLMTAASNQVYSQNNVGINTITPDASAALDVQSTSQGFLPPRMTYSQRQAIASPANGLVVFCTDCGVNGGELEVYAKGTWRNMMGDTAGIIPAIGKRAGGGIIAYILQPGDPGYDANMPHGLIAATSDQGTDVAWGCYGTPIAGADGSAIGTGNQNTIDIMNGCAGAGFAARICGDLVLNGYSDWYLPSIDELNKLYLNIGQGAPAPNTNIGGFSLPIAYWSSTEFDNSSSWTLAFINGDIESWPFKNFGLTVRAIRSF